MIAYIIKVDRRLANMKEAQAKEKAEKGPELKKKAEDKEAAWKAGAPERAAKKEEFKEIDEKSKLTEEAWKAALRSTLMAAADRPRASAEASTSLTCSVAMSVPRPRRE